MPLTPVGAGIGFLASEVFGPISSAHGSFYSVTGATGITSVFSDPSSTSAGTFSLQLNANTFPTTLCPATAENCHAGEQFIYDNNGKNSSVYIQYWLLAYPDSKCPIPATIPDVSHKWQWYGGSAGANGCYINGHMTPVPNQSISQLAALSLSGFNSSTQQFAVLETELGAQDLYGAPDDGDLLGLGSNWSVVEFNVFGLSNGALAQLSGGTTIVTQIDVNVGNWAAAPVTCDPAGITGEKNSLTLVPPCCVVQFGPAGPGTEAVNRILFTESNAPGATSVCACPTSTSWDPSQEACTSPPVGTNRCFSGLGSDEIWCPRLNRCLTQSEYKAECLFQKPTPP
ncbi:hypothetical protein [Paraburkholderia sp. 35.1]|uniref:hypothetical protein n=1 Tax=Paraburkholderia sp. 35.1 TaxID=2991058 RepID=UPI003D25FCB6